MKKHLLILFAAALVILQTGCVIPRSHSGLSHKDCPLDSVAVLPVEISPRVSNDDYPHDELRTLGNQVLNTLTKSADDNLLGPEFVRERLAGEAVPAPLRWLDVHDDIEATASDLAEFQTLSQKLGTDLVIRSSLAVYRRSPDSVGDVSGIAVGWDIDVDVRMELVDLKTGLVCRRASGSGDAGGTAGFFLYIPFYIDSTLGRGIDRAFREGFKEMYRAEEEEFPVTEKSIVPFETPESLD